jgi:hypothetical protein
LSVGRGVNEAPDCALVVRRIPSLTLTPAAFLAERRGPYKKRNDGYSAYSGDDAKEIFRH